MPEAPTHAQAREKAQEAYRKARVISLVLFAVLAAIPFLAAYLYGFEVGFQLSVGIAILSMVILPTPFGDLLTVCTLWTGTYVQSCPRCLQFGFYSVEIETHECATCGKIEGDVKPIAGGGWVTSDGEEYCSLECSREGDSA